MNLSEIKALDRIDYQITTFENGDWKYRKMGDTDRLEHLIRDDIELTEGIDARNVESYINGYWSYRSLDRYYHIFDKYGKELTIGIDARNIYVPDNGDWGYQTEDYLYRLFRGDIELTEGMDNVESVYSYNNFEWQYRDTNGWIHFFNIYNIEITIGLKAIKVMTHPNNVFSYQDTQGFYHLIRDNIELNEGIDSIWTYSYRDGSWSYQDINKIYHIFDGNGCELTQGLNVVRYYNSNDGKIEYSLEDEDKSHFFIL